jgi:hypothetical protein
MGCRPGVAIVGGNTSENMPESIVIWKNIVKLSIATGCEIKKSFLPTAASAKRYRVAGSSSLSGANVAAVSTSWRRITRITASRWTSSGSARRVTASRTAPIMVA